MWVVDSAGYKKHKRLFWYLFHNENIVYMSKRIILHICISIALLACFITQLYALIHSLQIATDTTTSRLVEANEFILFWLSLSGILASWVALHILVSPGYCERTCAPVKSRWLGMGLWPQICLWIFYIVAISSVASALVIFFTLENLHQLSLWCSFTMFLPIVCALALIPGFATRLRKLQNEQQENGLSNREEAATKHVENTSLATLMTTTMTAPAAPSLNGTVFHSPDMRKSVHSGRNHSSVYTDGSSSLVFTSEGISGESGESSHKVLGFLYRVISCKILAIAAALLAFLVYAMLLSTSVTRNRCNLSKEALGSHYNKVDVPLLKSDGKVQALMLSINCRGRSLLGQQMTVLIEHPAGTSSSQSSTTLQAHLIDQGHRVCIYDRPGYGLSPQGYAPLAAGTLSLALGSALRKMGEPGSYYLVSQQSGADYAQMFAEQNNPSSIVGMSLMYPTPQSLQNTVTTNYRGDSKEVAAEMATLPSDEYSAFYYYSPLWLNFNRAMAALVVPDNNEYSPNPDLVQAQYFERLSMPAANTTMQPAVRIGRAIPVMLYGVSSSMQLQQRYMKSVDGRRFNVEICTRNNAGSLPLANIAKQISWHINSHFY